MSLADGLYDCCWSESNEHILVSACGDGAVKVWDVNIPPAANPIRSYEEHGHEVHGVSWNMVRRDRFISASWDNSIKLWSLEAPVSLQTFQEHTYCCYAAAWNPTNGEVFASASGDCHVKLWDIRQRGSTLTYRAHDFEVLTLDWSKYEEGKVVTGSIDSTLRVWDLRFPNKPLRVLPGHKYAVRRVVCSPHFSNLVASISYDMSVALWDMQAPLQANPLIKQWHHHTEFGCGLDLSVLVAGLWASSGWDQLVYTWQQDSDPRV